MKPEKLPFKEAIDFYKAKIQLPTSGWTDIWQEQHSHAFVVAGAAQDALVEDFYNAIYDAKQNGGGYEDFRLRFDDIVAKHVWSYNGTPGWRSKIIYDTNIKQSYNAGRWQQQMAVKHLRPYLTYNHHTIEHPRIEHKKLDGITLPIDDPFWGYYYPQNAWGCNCTADSLSEFEAQALWTSQGKSGPDESPAIEWEEKTVGAKGSNPRTVRVPKGIDPGFAYNPGKAYLEPLTVPPLTGYDAVLKQRDKPWPTGFKVPDMPKPTKVSSNILLPADIAPAAAVTEFLDIFGATLEQGAAFTDAAGSTLAITKALFEDGKGDFKWLANTDKEHRLQYLNLLAMTLIEPDEIWWVWVQDAKEKGRWRLKRRYLRALEIDGKNEFAYAVFEWGQTGWTGSTVFMGSQKSEKAREGYFDRQRAGRMVFKK
ncbi:PBECR2 nuclease fold domain-containing protein [Methylomonas sp. 11b]|uniref:PBECR2 nuclease fold domain-containing protein n=1 Tax=Methylomonas sp. 11b TaxID=1168169 RepID=UPI00047D6F52|nr:PBECR2 nuclease fold domain-containing protein [Methylomonas sp. 11b]